MKIKRRVLQEMMSNGCTCIFFEGMCASCFAADLLGKPPSQRRPGYVEKLVYAFNGGRGRGLPGDVKEALCF